MPPSFSSLQGARFGGPVRQDVASCPWVGISASVSVRVWGVRDGVGGSARHPNDSESGSGIDCYVDDSRNSQSHFRSGIWPILCRRSPGNAAGGHLPCPDVPSFRFTMAMDAISLDTASNTAR
jgi:hypothetical protein